MNGYEPLGSPQKKGGRGKWIALFILFFVVTAGGAFYLGNVFAYSTGFGGLVDGEIIQEYQDVDAYKKLFDIRGAIYQYYDGEIDDAALLEGAIKGMTEALGDPYTVFMNREEYSAFNQQSEGEYVGLGIQVGVRDNKIVVIAPFDGSPAAEAGIIPGDLILSVNGTEVSGEDIDLAVSMMKGNDKVPVDLNLYRESKGTFEVSVTRDTIQLITVEGEMLDNNIGYISISSFDEHTDEDFSEALAELKSKGMKGLILDLRDNPGGLLTTSVSVVSNFIERGKVVVSTIDKYNKKDVLNSEGGEAIGLPLVVLVNEYSASASEIVSGAIRDYDAGTLIGTTTFGKGIVQSMLTDTKDGTALKVTISKYYTPLGENIHGTGIAPDIEVEYPDELREQLYDRAKDPQFTKALEVIKEKVQ